MGNPNATDEQIMEAIRIVSADEVIAHLENGLDTVAVTDHFWDSAVAGASSWYKPLSYEHVFRSLPLPKNDTVRFLFGCETDMDMQGSIGLTKENFSLDGISKSSSIFDEAKMKWLSGEYIKEIFGTARGSTTDKNF